MAEELEKKENAEPKRRGRPRKNKEEVKETGKTTEKKVNKTKKEESKEEKKEITTEPKRRGRPKKNSKEAEEKKEALKNNSAKKDTKKKVEKKTENKNEKENLKEKQEENKLTVKKEAKDIIINDEKLEKIEEEIKKQKNISDEKRKKINKRIFKNVIVAIVIIMYFIFVNLGFANLELEKYLVDLKAFSIVIIGITIVLFEKAYKKDSGEITIFGIETLALAIITLLTSYFCVRYKMKYPYIINCIAVLFGLYYIVKSTIIYIKMRRKALYVSGDIHKIVKK